LPYLPFGGSEKNPPHQQISLSKYILNFLPDQEKVILEVYNQDLGLCKEEANWKA
jgi:hypothetical protein